MRDRNDIEELMHDAKQEAYTQKRKLALEELKRQYWYELTYGEISEAIAEFGCSGIAVYFAAPDATDDSSFFLSVKDAVNAWIEHQAEQEIQRRERKGEFV